MFETVNPIIASFPRSFLAVGRSLNQIRKGINRSEKEFKKP